MQYNLSIDKVDASSLGLFALGEKETTALPDGNYLFREIKEALQVPFESEKDFCDYIELNIDNFCRDCLGLQHKSHKREYQIGGKNKKFKGSKVVDFFIHTECGQYIALECKHPKYISELAAGLGQSLGYLTLFELNEQRVDKLIIVSTKLDWYLPAIVRKFNLPIGFIALDKSKHITYLNGH